MKFIYPSFLWALLLILIPIIIHFVNFRKHQVVYFSNVNLLKRVQKETKRRSKLKQIIILSLRILALAALVFAFAKPYFPIAGVGMQHADNVVAIYIDNSFSMNAETTEGLAIDNAKAKALTIVNAEKTGSRFALFTNSLQEKQHRLYSKNEIIDLIGEVQISHQQVPLSTINLRMKDVLDRVSGKADKNIYFISDFQRYACNLEAFEPSETMAYNFVPLKGNVQSNLSIDSCWFDTPAHFPGQIEQLSVRITNRGDIDLPQLPVNLYLNDSLKSLANIKLNGGESIVVQMSFANSQAPIVQGRIEISDYPIVYDNIFYLSYTVESKKRVLALTTDKMLVPTTQNLNTLFTNDEYISFEAEVLERLQISKLSTYNCVIIAEPDQLSSGVSEALVNYVSEGGTLVIVPQINENAAAMYDSWLKTFQLGRIVQTDTSTVALKPDLYASALFKDVFRETSANSEMPTISKRFRFESDLNVMSVMSFADGQPALMNIRYNNGNVYLFNFQALSGTANTFAKHLLFVPTFYNLALKASFNPDLFNTIGIDRLIPVLNPFEALPREVVMKNLQTNVEITPSVKQHEGNVLGLYAGNEIQAGNYAIQMNDEVVAGTAYNYDLHESELDFYSPDELQKYFQQAGIKNFNIINAEKSGFEVALAELDSGRQFWKWFIVFALLFLISEALVIRFWP